MPKLLSRALLLLALVWLVWGALNFATVSVAGRVIGVPVVAALIAAAVVRRARPEVGLAAVSTLWTLSLGALLLWSFSPGFRYEIRSRLELSAPVGIWQTDERYGYSHIRGAVGVQAVPDSFRVTYRIDGDGCRETRTPGPGADLVLFLGGSVTFGHGVEDDEAFPAVLAERYWRNVKVRNRAVGGWGTAQAYLALEDDLKSGLRPRVVLYGWLSDHVRRNYIWRSWVDTMAKHGRLHPWFDLEKGWLVYRGTIGPSQAVEENRKTRIRASSITVHLIAGMDRMAREAGAEFALVRLGDVHHGKDGPQLGFEEAILRKLRARGVQIIDVRAARGTGLPFDLHPASDWHANVAGLLADARTLRDLSR